MRALHQNSFRVKDFKSRLHFSVLYSKSHENVNALCMHYDFNEFSSHLWHIQSLCGLDLLIIHEFSVIVIMLCFCTNVIPLSQGIQTCMTWICKSEPFRLNCLIQSFSSLQTVTAISEPGSLPNDH